MRNSQYFAKVLCFSCLFLVIYAKYYIPEDILGEESNKNMEPSATTQFKLNQISQKDKAIQEILQRYEAKVKKRNPEVDTKIVGDKLYIDYVPYGVNEVLDMESRETIGVLTSWSYPKRTTPTYPIVEDTSKIWYTHRFEDLVNLNETMLRILYNKEWTVLKRGLMRDRKDLFHSAIAAGMLWTEGYPFKVEEILKRENDIMALKKRNKMRGIMNKLNITTTPKPRPSSYEIAELNRQTRKIKKEKEEYIHDILEIFEEHYRTINKSTTIAGVFLWINSIPHWADDCILRYEWEQKNPGNKYRWHPKRRPISDSELSSSSDSSDYDTFSNYCSSDDSDYKDEFDDSLSMSEKKRRRKERFRRKKPMKESQFTPEERVNLTKAIYNRLMGGL